MANFHSVIGIDLGTTSSVVAVHDHDAGQAVVLPNSDGGLSIPSVVALDPHGRVVVGESARRILADDPTRAVADFKRRLGETTPAGEPFRLQLGGESFLPEEIAALLLMKIKDIAERTTGHHVHDAVLVVPASLNQAQRDAVKRAALLAGLMPRKLIAKSFAAATCRAAERPEAVRKHYLVYALGGTFETAVVAIEEKRVEVVAFAGDVGLTGSTLPVLRQSLDHVEAALRDAETKGLRREDLDGILLVGSASDTALARTVLRVRFRKDESFFLTDNDPESIVARGAAVLAARFNPTPAPFASDEARDRLFALYRGARFLAPQPPVELNACAKPLESEHVPQVLPRAKKPELNEVQFTVYRPRTVRPGVWYPLLAFTHLAERRPDAPATEPDPIEQVREQAKQVLGAQAKDFRDTSVDARQAVPREGEITLLPDIPGIELNPPRRVFRWIEDVHREEFRLRASAELNGTTARGTLSVYLGTILLAEVDLALKVDSASAMGVNPNSDDAISARPYHKIFASYSHRDVEIVRQYEHFVASLGDRYLRDVRDLRAGEAWDEGLLRLIDQADVFQLFWSCNAMVSPFVRREWEYALSLKRPRFIRPTYWEEPFPESQEQRLPPEELRRLHFHRLGFEQVPGLPHDSDLSMTLPMHEQPHITRDVVREGSAPGRLSESAPPPAPRDTAGARRIPPVPYVPSASVGSPPRSVASAPAAHRRPAAKRSRPARSSRKSGCQVVLLAVLTAILIFGALGYFLGWFASP